MRKEHVIIFVVLAFAIAGALFNVHQMQVQLSPMSVVAVSSGSGVRHMVLPAAPLVRVVYEYCLLICKHNTLPGFDEQGVPESWPYRHCVEKCSEFIGVEN